MSVAIVRGLFVCSLLFLLVGAAHAQDPTQTPKAVERPASPFVTAPEIPEASERLQQMLTRLADSLAAEPAIVAIEDGLPLVREQAARSSNDADVLLAGSPTLDQLRDLEASWSARRDSLAKDRRALARRAGGVESHADELVTAGQLWVGTLNHARETRSPVGVLAAVEANLIAIENTAKSVHERRRVVLTLLTDVSEQELLAAGKVERIERTRARLRAQVFEPDADTIWRALADAESGRSFSRVADSVASDWDELVDFSIDRRRTFAPIAVAFALLVVLLYQVRTRLRRRTDGDRLQGRASVFERPVSVALLAAGLVGSTAFSFVPAIVRDFGGIALLVPVLRILMPLLPGVGRRSIGTLAVFYVVDRIRDLISPAELLERSLFGIETTAAFILIWVVLRPRPLASTPRDVPGLAVLGVALRVAMAIFAASTLANAFGYVAFAKLTGDGVLASAYLALVAFAAYRIGTTLVVVLLSSSRLSWAHALQTHSARIGEWSRWAIGLWAVSVWGLGTLEAFAIRDVVVTALDHALSSPIEVGTLSVSLGSVLAFPLTIFIAFLVSRAIQSLLDEDVFPRVYLKRGVGNAITTTVHYALLLGGFFLALGASGIDLTRFAILAGALGVGIGFGLQNVVNNFVSGLILLYERPIQVGDNIEIGGLLGEVRGIGIRASTIRTFQGAEVIVPNGTLLSDQLVNWTLSNAHRRVEVPIGVAYGNRPSKVIEVLGRVMEGEDRIYPDPRPLVLFRGFGNSSLDFELRFWARDYSTYVQLASDVASAVYDELEREGITVPFPQRDLHLKSVDADVAKTLRGGDPE